MTPLSGQSRAVVVTGASSGIGAATVRALAQGGILVFAGVRNEADAHAAAAHANVVPLRLDVTDPQAIAGAAQAVRANGASLVGVVNNAGVAVAGPLESLALEDLRRQLEVNVIGAIAVAQAFLPLLHAQKGRLVFVGSVSGRIAFPFTAPYSASKFALRAIANAWRLELRPAGICVSLVEPGSVRTPIWDKGRAGVGEVLARLPAESPGHYRTRLEQLAERSAHEERSGMPPERVAQAIVHALTASRPRAWYPIGAAARIGSLLALLPGAVQDRFIGGSLK